MARKTLADLKPKGVSVRDITDKSMHSWVVLGLDTSMTSLAVTGIGYDAVFKRLTNVQHLSIRWTPEDDYFERIRQSAKLHDRLFEVLPIILPLERVFIFQEEPVPLGMMKARGANFESGWVKQQCEISGAVLGSLTRWGYANIVQINNNQWKATLRKEGVTIRKMPEGKWDIKDWAIQAYGLPELPDLVKGKTGGKVPRPESGFGANAKAVQPDDIYDAAACMAYGVDYVESLSV